MADGVRRWRRSGFKGEERCLLIDGPDVVELQMEERGEVVKC